MTEGTASEEKRREKLSGLMDVKDELELIAASDVAYAKDARNWLEALDEAGFDVPLPHKDFENSAELNQKRERVSDSQYCPQCGDGVGAEDRFCRHCGHELTDGTTAKRIDPERERSDEEKMAALAQRDSVSERTRTFAKRSLEKLRED